MSFDTLSFWLFFLIIFILANTANNYRHQNYILLLGSYFFYGLAHPFFLLIILVSTLTDFICGHYAYKNHKRLVRKAAVSTSLFINIGLLISFKYVLPIFNNHNDILPESLMKYGIPLGISFYTFQTLSYTLDIYRGQLKPHKNLLDFALFVSFFPQLVAGPIERAKNLLPQFLKKRQISKEDLQKGSYLILLGLFKKIYVANSLAVAVDFVFNIKTPISSLSLIAPILMTFQVYSDFSGYSNMARGMAKLLGINLLTNFKPFFLATTPLKFWQCWHISLTSWIRDYVIIPFRDPKKRRWHFRLQILITFILVGIWHNLTLNWILFGLLHSLALIFNYSFRDFTIKTKSRFILMISTFLSSIGMYFLYFLSGVLHRSQNMKQVYNIINSAIKFSDWNISTANYLQYIFIFLGPLIIFEYFQLKSKDEFFLLKHPWLLQVCIYSLAMFSILFLERTTQLGFIYFSF